jgi:excisionase family DNA binding protein
MEQTNLELILTKIDDLSAKLDVSIDKPLTLEEAADYMGITPSGLYKLNLKRAIPYSKPGQRIYYRRSDLDAYMMSKRISSAEQIDTQATQRLMR